MRRSSVRRAPADKPGWRRCISSKDRHRPQARRRLQHRYDLGVEEVDERIRASAAACRFLGGRQVMVLLVAIRGRRADRCLGGGYRRAVCLSERHVEPHLVIGDVAAGQQRIPS